MDPAVEEELLPLPAVDEDPGELPAAAGSLAGEEPPAESVEPLADEPPEERESVR